MKRYGEVCLRCPIFEAYQRPGGGEIFLCSKDELSLLIDAEKWERYQVPEGCLLFLEQLVLNEENHEEPQA